MLAYVARNAVLIARTVLRRVPGALVSSFGIVFFIAFLIVFIALRTGVRDYLENRIFSRLNINEIRVTPKSKTTLINLNIFSAEKTRIPEGAARRIQRLEGVAKVHRVVRLDVPVTMTFGMFGALIKSDMLISGIDRDFFRGSKIPWRVPKDDEMVPVVVPYFALELYNNFANAAGTPEMGEKFILGKTMELTFGKSFMFGSGGLLFGRSGPERRTVIAQGQIVGFTSQLNTAGLVLPAEYIRALCRKNPDLARRPGECTSNMMLIVRVSDPRHLPAVSQRIRDLGLAVESKEDIAQRTQKAVGFIDAVFFMLLMIILALTVIAIFNSYLTIVYNRSYEISLERMLGATKVRIIAIFIIEAAIVGLVYGLAGFLLGSLAVTKLAHYAGNWVPLLGGLTISFNASAYAAMALGASVAVSALSALVPAVFASNLSLFDNVKRF
ncbi:MAG TPA: hypothetical protein PKJ16_13490 [Spirochaetota bacterium]|mgnify:CR=1 FL=1|nr:hypothetical protein [Spirochaetota bacterium]HPU89684.1 hypothetical protein [Spirochaetota bacterium]